MIIELAMFTKCFYLVIFIKFNTVYIKKCILKEIKIIRVKVEILPLGETITGCVYLSSSVDEIVRRTISTDPRLVPTQRVGAVTKSVEEK